MPSTFTFCALAASRCTVLLRHGRIVPSRGRSKAPMRSSNPPMRAVVVALAIHTSQAQGLVRHRRPHEHVGNMHGRIDRQAHMAGQAVGELGVAVEMPCSRREFLLKSNPPAHSAGRRNGCGIAFTRSDRNPPGATPVRSASNGVIGA